MNILHKLTGRSPVDETALHYIWLSLACGFSSPAARELISAFHGADAVFCAMLAQNAVHAAMAGRTDMVIGHWGDNFTHVPISLATRRRKKIDLNSQLWTSVRATTCF